MEQRRKNGVPIKLPQESQESLEVRLLGQVSPLRRSWVREFLQKAYGQRSRKTREILLRAICPFDDFLANTGDVGHGQWSLVTPDHVESYLARKDGTERQIASRRALVAFRKANVPGAVTAHFQVARLHMGEDK